MRKQEPSGSSRRYALAGPSDPLFSVRSLTPMQDVLAIPPKGASVERPALAYSLAPTVAGIQAETPPELASAGSCRSKLWLIPLQMNLLILPVCAVLFAVAAPAWAGLSRNDAAVAAQRLTNARVLSVAQTEAEQRQVWRVKVVTAQGEVRVILMDAASGHVL